MAGFSLIGYVITAFLPAWYVALPITVALLLGLLFLLKFIGGKKAKA